MYQVLIIDDDKLARKGLISIVPWEEYGMTVVGDVPNGLCAMEFLREQAVDLAIVDMSMPIMSGLEFIEASQKEFPRLQYVVLSFYESFEYVQSALRLGALDYISKLRLEEDESVLAFQRIGALLAKKFSDPIFREEAPLLGVEPERLKKLWTCWDRLYWMYDQVKLEDMALELEETPLSLPQMEKLAFWIGQKLESCFHKPFPTPSFLTKGEYIHWISLCKKQLEEDCLTQPNYTLIPVCILSSVLYINRHLAEPIRSRDVAEAVQLSRSYFSTIFKKLTGSTFHEYVLDKRILLAKSLLQQRNYTVAELAVLVGYEDSKYFSKVFQEREGVSCSQYRKQFTR